MRAPVGIERTEQASPANHLAKRPERAHGAFLGHEEARIDLRRRIVQGDDQIPPLPANPLMAGAVLAQHHPRHRPPRPLAPVRPTPRRRLDPTVRLQRQANPVVAPRHAVLGGQLLPEMLGREIPVARVEQIQQRHHLVDPAAPRRYPAQTTIVQTFRPVGLETLAIASKRPFRHPQNLRRLRLAQLAAIAASVYILELHQPQSL